MSTGKFAILDAGEVSLKLTHSSTYSGAKDRNRRIDRRRQIDQHFYRDASIPYAAYRKVRWGIPTFEWFEVFWGSSTLAHYAWSGMDGWHRFHWWSSFSRPRAYYYRRYIASLIIQEPTMKTQTWSLTSLRRSHFTPSQRLCTVATQSCTLSLLGTWRWLGLPLDWSSIPICSGSYSSF